MAFNFSNMKPTESPQLSLKDKIINRLKTGNVVPIISHSFISNLIFQNYYDLVEYWATNIVQYPKQRLTLPCPTCGKPAAHEINLAPLHNDLAVLAQYHKLKLAQNSHTPDELEIKEKYLSFLNEALFFIASEDENVPANKISEQQAQDGRSFSDLAWHFNYPSFDSPRNNPLLYLAELDIPIYITTSYHRALEQALEKVGKQPIVGLCHWHRGLEGLPRVLDEHEPTAQQPLVYHLYGRDDIAKSLVLTEDDFLDFLTNITTEDNRVVEARVNQALVDSTLLLLGYRLDATEFKVLFRGVIKPRPQVTAVRNVAIQLEDMALSRDLLEKYLRQSRFEVEWTDTADYIRELYRGCR